MKAYLKILQLLTLLVFAGVLVFPTLNSACGFIREAPDAENRTKHQRPEFTGDHIDGFVKAYDDYYTDNFSLRNNLIAFINQFEFFAFSVSPVPDQVVVGKHGWFYFKNGEPNYTGANAFSQAQLDSLEQELHHRTQWAAEHGARYYVVVVPNKMTMYPEFLPDQIKRTARTTRYDQVVALDRRQGIHVIDLRKNLLLHKAHSVLPLYQLTDDHWNELGAYYGYQEIMNRLHADYPELSPYPLNDFWVGIDERTGNIATMIHEEQAFPEQFVTLAPMRHVYGHDGVKRGYKVPSRISEWDYENIKVNAHAPPLKCLVIRDSFTLLMINFLQEQFRECVFIHGEWEYKMHEDLVLKEKPDIVLNIVLENELGKLLQFPFRESDTLSVKATPVK